MRPCKASRITALALFISLFFAGLLSATADPTSSIQATLGAFCSGATAMLPPAAMLMVVIGAVVYAAGQVMGAETRARANVWATAALMGAFVAMLITTVSPPVLQMIYGKTVSCTGVAPPPAATMCSVGNTWSGSGTCLCKTGVGEVTCTSGQKCCDCEIVNPGYGPMCIIASHQCANECT